MMRALKRAISSAFMEPDGALGWIVLNYMRWTNRYLEENAVRLCRLESNEQILEVGFGPGIGLAAACKIIKDGAGSGKVHGVDLSRYVVEKAEMKFKDELISGRLQLHWAHVIQLPFQNDQFDRVFHCNCYYYWPELEVCSKEIYRVMKPGGLMITTLNIKELRRLKKEGWKMFAQTDQIIYMTALENAGFVDVHIDYLQNGDDKYQAIFAKKNNYVKMC